MSTPYVTNHLKRFVLPQTTIARFTVRRTARSAAFWALVFGFAVTAKSAGYAAAYPTSIARAKLAASFSSNVGLSALFGTPHDIASVTGFAVWNTLSIMVIIGGIWAFLCATKNLRGEEEAGRWELLLSGQTTARRAATNALAGLGGSLLVMYAVTATAFIGIGKLHSVHYGIQAGLFFALVAVSSATMFTVVGVLAAQLMPTRSRAASLSAAIFGACFLVRAMADTTSVHWLLDITPLGWIERLQPLYGSNPIWLIPIGLFTLACSLAAVYLAGRRDLGASIFPDADSAKPRYRLLNNPLLLSFRLSRGGAAAWLLGVSFVAVFFGLLAKPAGRAFAQSATLARKFSVITHAAQAAGARVFLGIVFFLIITLIMAYAASAVAAMRREEADGYLDNLLVRVVGRGNWLWGRLLLISVTIAFASLLASVGVWIGIARQGVGVSYHALLLAAGNAVAAPVLILGLGVLMLGMWPRATSLVAYGALAWSFIIDLLSSGLKLNHWILDTSILQHLSLAPATNPNWTAVIYIIGLGVLGCLIGSLGFVRRDLEAE